MANHSCESPGSSSAKKKKDSTKCKTDGRPICNFRVAATRNRRFHIVECAIRTLMCRMEEKTNLSATQVRAARSHRWKLRNLSHKYSHSTQSLSPWDWSSPPKIWRQCRMLTGVKTWKLHPSSWHGAVVSLLANDEDHFLHVPQAWHRCPIITWERHYASSSFMQNQHGLAGLCISARQRSPTWNYVMMIDVLRPLLCTR